MAGADDDLYRRPIRGQRRLKRQRKAAATPDEAVADMSFSRHRLPAYTTDAAGTARTQGKRRRALTLRRGGRRRGRTAAGDLAADGTRGGAEPPHHSRPPFWVVLRRASIVLALVGCCELAAAALTSPRLAVQDVDIVGAEITSPAALKEFTSTLIGQNWIRAHVREATRAVSSLPTVRSAQVVRVVSWPPSLQLQIVERQPFARVGGGGQWWVVDRYGVPFRRAAGSDEDLYAITAPTLQPQFGQPLPPAVWNPVVDLAAVITDARRADASSQDWALRRIYFDKQGFASLRLAGGANDQLLVRLGVGQWPAKLRRARQALDFFARTGRHAMALNLISYSRPTWTPQPAGAVTDPTFAPGGAEVVRAPFKGFGMDSTPAPDDAVGSNAASSQT